MTNTHKALPKTMAELRSRNKALGNYWFDQKTMRFWGTRLETSLLKGGYFVTSEYKTTGNGRGFTIRQAAIDGSVRTVGPLNQYRSKAGAKNAIVLLYEQTT